MVDTRRTDYQPIPPKGGWLWVAWLWEALASASGSQCLRINVFLVAFNPGGSMQGSRLILWLFCCGSVLASTWREARGSLALTAGRGPMQVSKLVAKGVQRLAVPDALFGALARLGRCASPPPSLSMAVNTGFINRSSPNLGACGVSPVVLQPHLAPAQESRRGSRLLFGFRA